MVGNQFLLILFQTKGQRKKKEEERRKEKEEEEKKKEREEIRHIIFTCP